MKREEQVRLIGGLMQHLDDGTNVDAGHQLWNPVSGYTSGDMAAQEHMIFGRNEPALRHYHNTFREALGLPALEAVEP
jgi:hypothetical protein